jgi:endonuclease-8
MPEGHTVHRLAAALQTGFGGSRVRTSSPQGRFATEAAGIDGWVLADAEAAGKHLLLGFVPDLTVDPHDPQDTVTRFVHVHLGLYGSWTFAGDDGFALAPAIGAPRVGPGAHVRVGEQEDATDIGPVVDDDDWRYIVPRSSTRLRIVGPHGLADLTGPNTCEVVDRAGRAAILERLGPDPLREDAEPARFVDRVRRSRTVIGTLLMNQDVIAGVGNIYRAEALFRARLDPFVPGADLSAGIVRGIWEDLVPLMAYGARTGRIVTTEPEDRDVHAQIVERSRGTRQNGDGEPGIVPREKSFYVYHRQTLPCRICGTVVRSGDLAGRTVFWCPRCQTVRQRRSPWSRRHPAAAWTSPAGTGTDPANVGTGTAGAGVDPVGVGTAAGDGS